MKHLLGVLVIGSSAWQCFHPLRHLVNSNEDVVAILGLPEWPHEVNAPHIKYFYLKIVVEGHCVARGDATL